MTVAVTATVGGAGLVAPVEPVGAVTAPSALADRIVTDEDAARTFDPLANDTGNLDTGSVQAFPPRNGTATVDAASGHITYTPTTHYNGPDAFTYTVCDTRNACVAGQVDVTVEMYGHYRMVVTSPPNNDFTGPITLMHPDGSGPRDDVDPGPSTYGGGSFGQISPDGKWLAIASGASVGLFNLRDDNERTSASFPREVAAMSWSPDSSRFVAQIGDGGSLPPNRTYYTYTLSSGTVDGPLSYTLSDANGVPTPVPVIGQGAAWGPNGITIGYWYEYTTPTSGLQHAGLATFTPTDTPRVRVEAAGVSDPAAGSDGRLAMRCPEGLCTMTANGAAMTVVVPLPSFQTASSIAWSPDNSKIAFNLVDSDARVAVVNADGTGLRELNSRGRVLNASWDPRPYTPKRPWDVAGNLAFVHDRTINGEVHRTIETARPDGSGRHTIELASGELAVDIAWSPDGHRLAVSVTTPGFALVTLRVMNADGTGAHDIASDVIGTFDWSPDGQNIVLGRQLADSTQHLYIGRADGTGATRMIEVGRAPDNNYSPSYSPDGQYVVYQADLPLSPTHIYSVRADGTAAPAQITGVFGNAKTPDVSSRSDLVYIDGGLVVADIHWSPAPYVLANRVVSAAGPAAPRWSPDGQAIAYIPSGTRRVSIVNADGSRNTQIADDTFGIHLSAVWGATPPELTGITPRTGPTAGGTTVTVTGTGFGGPGTTVTFGGQPATVTSGSPTGLIVITPAHTTGPVDVAVTNPNGETTVLTGAYLYADSPAPTLTTLGPASGPAAGGTAVTVTGTGFGGPGTQVSFGGVPATGTGGSATTVDITAPAHTAGVVDVVLTNPDGQTATLPAAYTYLARPAISTVTPNSGPSAGGTTVTVIGTGFGGPGTTAKIGGTAASVTGGSATTLTLTTPAHTAGTVDVVVTNPDGQTATASGAYTYLDGPTISSITPAQGPTTGATAVTVTGTGFGGPGTTVTIGGAPATIVTGSASRLDVLTPAHTAGTVDVVVTNTDGQQATATNGYQYLVPPSIQSLTPTTGTALGGTSVTITGAGFGGPGTTATFGGVAATIRSGSATTLTLDTPAHAAGTVDVVVTNPDGERATRASGFTYLATQPAPVLNSVKPTTGTTAGGVKATITGSNFRAGMVVTFGGVAATAVVVTSPTKATLRTPAHPAGKVNVAVTNSDGQTSTCRSCFAYNTPRRP